MIKIRLTRVGKKKHPIYRMIVADSRKARDGRFIEIVGHYNPHTEPATVTLKEDRIMEWLGKGAQPTDSAKRLMIRDGLWSKFSSEEHVWPEKAKKEAPAAAAEEAAAPESE